MYKRQALKFLNGDEKEIINNLEDKMKKAAAELEFEQAAEYRDLIENVKRIGEKQKINDTGGDDRDIIALAKTGDEAVVAIFFIRSGKLLGRDHFHMTGIGDSEKQEDVYKRQDKDRMRYEGGQYYLKSEEEMQKVFPYAREAMDNTHKIAERCNVEIVFGEQKVPKFDVPEGYDAFRCV